MATNSGVRPRGRNWNPQPPPPQQPFMRHNPAATMLPLSTPTAQPTHLMGYPAQPQPQRRALLSGPTMITAPNNQRGGHLTQMRYPPQVPQIYAPNLMQANAVPGLSPYPNQFAPQQIYSGMHAAPSHPPPPTTSYTPGNTIRAQHRPPKRKSNAIAIVDPDTKTELDVRTLPKGTSTGNNTGSTTLQTASTDTVSQSNSSSTVGEQKRKEFVEQMQEITSSTTNTGGVSSDYRPNALISSPSTERHTGDNKPSLIKHEGSSLLPDPVIPPIKPSQAIEIKSPTDTKPVSSKLIDTKPATSQPPEVKSITSQQTDTKPVTSQPTVDTKSITSQPTGIKPAVTSQPTDTKSVTSQPTDSKSVTSQPTDSKSVTSQPTDSKSVTSDTKSVTSDIKSVTSQLSDTKPATSQLTDTKSQPTDTKSVSTQQSSPDTKLVSSTQSSPLTDDIDKCRTDPKSETKSTITPSPVDLSSTEEGTVTKQSPPVSTSERHPKAAGLLPTPPISALLPGTHTDTPKLLEEIYTSTLSKLESSISSIATTNGGSLTSNDTASTTNTDKSTSQELIPQEESSSGDDMTQGDIPNGHITNKDHEVFKDAQGRYIYRRDFLLQYSALPLPPPTNLKDHDIFIFGAGQRSSEIMRKSPQGSYPSRPSKTIKVIDHHPSKAEKVELRKAEHRWKRPVQRDDTEDAGTDELFRKFQGILNKLTPQKFKDLAERARDLEINTEERLKGCIDKIFSKALEEPNFSVAYAHLCRVLSVIKVEVVKVDENGEETVRETTFRRELLTRCQKEFEKDKRDDEVREEKLKAIEEATPEEKSLKEAELKEWEDKTRKRSLGNIRFIGELFKLKMLSESIMHECIVRLLRSTSDEDALECFSRLITTTGKELDHQQAKQRLDRYFERIDEIIEKRKISSRIRFMLQDVQEMRKNDWIPRKQETLKTIDQIHHEAEMEAIQEKEMIRAMQPVSGKQYPRDGGDKKKVGKGGQDDYSSGRTKGDKGAPVRRDSTPDVNRITALQKKEKSTPTLGPSTGPSLRPGGWKSSRNQGPTPPPPSSTAPTTGSTAGDSKDKPSKGSGPQRSSSSGKRQNSSSSSSGRNSQQGVKRASTNPDERSEALKAIRDFYQPPQAPSVPPPATGVKKPVEDKLTEEKVERKTGTIVDELAQNGDFKEAVECVVELESPGLLHVFVRTAINHSLEKSSAVRVMVGKLFDHLVKQSHLNEEKLSQGLQEVLEFADDLEVDIPKIWDFFSELVTPMVCSNSLSLLLYGRLLNEANLGRKAARNIARTLKDCLKHVGREKVCQLWEGTNMKWTDLGLHSDEVKEFLQNEELSFLSSQSPISTSTTSSGTVAVSDVSPPYNPPYLKDLTSLFGSQNSTTDDILDWIEKQVSKEEAKTTNFIKTLARAAVDGSSTGEGNSHRFNDENFSSRLTLLKKWVDQDEELQEIVLEGVQVGVTLLKHPPGLLYKMLHLLYDVEVVSEAALQNWYRTGKEQFGRGVTMQSSKRFFSWLESAETESDNETGS